MQIIRIMTWNIKELKLNKLLVAAGIGQTITMIPGSAANTYEPADIVFIIELDATSSQAIMRHLCEAANSVLRQSSLHENCLYECSASAPAGNNTKSKYNEAYGVLWRPGRGIKLLEHFSTEPAQGAGKSSGPEAFLAQPINHGFVRNPGLFVFDVGDDVNPYLLPILVCHLKAWTLQDQKNSYDPEKKTNPLALNEVAQLKDLHIAQLFNNGNKISVQIAPDVTKDLSIKELIVTGDFNFNFNLDRKIIDSVRVIATGQNQSQVASPEEVVTHAALEFLTPTRAGEGSSSPDAAPGTNPEGGRLALKAANTTQGTLLKSPFTTGLDWSSASSSQLHGPNFDNFFYGGTKLSDIPVPPSSVDTCLILDMPMRVYFPFADETQTSPDLLNGESLMEATLELNYASDMIAGNKVKKAEATLTNAKNTLETKKILFKIDALRAAMNEAKKALENAIKPDKTKLAALQEAERDSKAAFNQANNQLVVFQKNVDSAKKAWDDAKKSVASSSKTKNSIPPFLDLGNLKNEKERLTIQHRLEAARAISDHLPIILQVDLTNLPQDTD